jgi:FkbM family methyltransferase
MKVANRLLRRSGIAVALIAELLEWEPTAIFQVGVGTHHKEIDVFQEAWPDAVLFGWEPHPEIAKDLEYPGLLHEFALGRESGTKELHYDPAHLEAASFYPAERTLQTVSVEVRALGDCYPPPDDEEALFWLDCEGAELEVLEGAGRFLKGVDVINIELTGKPSRDGWPSPVTVGKEKDVR